MLSKIEQIAERHAARTKGTWVSPWDKDIPPGTDPGDVNIRTESGDVVVGVGQYDGYNLLVKKADAAHIVSAGPDIDYLLDEVRLLSAERDTLRGQLAAVRAGLEEAYCALVVVEVGEKIVVVSRAGTDKYVLPGGKVEDNETPRQAAAREGREETGYPLLVAFLPFYVGVSHNGKPLHAFRATVNDTVAVVPQEWQSSEGTCKLVTVEEARALYLPEFRGVFNRLMEALDR